MKSRTLTALILAGTTSFLAATNPSGSQVRITETDDYNQWEEAKTAKAGANPANFYKLPGFEVELLHSAQNDEGSWVSCVFDPQGRLSIGREDAGILRYTFSKDRARLIKKEWLLRQAKECRGLLYAHDALFLNASKSKILFRFRDTNGDDQFDEEKQLFETPGGGGHGRNGLALGPDGLIYAIMGDAVKLPFHIPNLRDHTSPLRRKQKVFRPNEGHVLRFDKNGDQPAIFAAGLRNPYGIDFNTDGEAFTFDADAEFDMGSPWYRPTQIKHLTSGADFGWRAVTGSWPPYYPDHPANTPACVDIGKSSPTGMLAGTRGRFPHYYRNVMFALDWTYGRILAIHLTTKGATYKGRPEVFLRGRPLNVTDADFGPDGAMYFVTGGRGTQSALYRVTYTGPIVNPTPQTTEELSRNEASRKSRATLKRLETYHRPGAGKLYLPTDLGDPIIRHAARIALEHQLFDNKNVDTDDKTDPNLLALAKAHAGIPTSLSSTQASLSPEELHTWRLNLPRFTDKDKEALRKRLRQNPDAETWLAAELRIDLEMPEATASTLALLLHSQTQREQIHYLYLLRKARTGWTSPLRRNYFQHLADASNFLGGRGLPNFITKIRKDAISTLTEAEKTALGDLLDNNKHEPPPLPDLSHRKFVRAWSIQDFPAKLTLPRKTDLGQKLFDEGLCSRCHKFGRHGFSIGPDLTQVARRLGTRDLLQAILEPSKAIAENYQTHILDLHDGRQLSGQIIPQVDYRSRHLLLATNPIDSNTTIKVPKAELKAYRRSDFSIMPTGLLNTFSRKEVISLIAWLRKGE